MSLDFTAVDFETANGFRGSPCSVGLVRVRDGAEVASLYRLMRPPVGFDRFDPRNVAVHGIGSSDVADRPRFADLFSELMDFLGDDDLVAHNAAFDIEVFESSLEVSGLAAPRMRAWCSVELSRAEYRLPSHALPHAAAAAGHELTAHHHALADARACAAIVVDVAARRRARTLEEMFSAESLTARELPAWTAPRDRESRATRQVRGLGTIFDARDATVDSDSLPDLMRWQDEGRNPPPRPDADPDHRLFGEQVVFSGTLAMPRARAKELCAARGARTASRVTAGTTLIVIGDGFRIEELCEADQSSTLRSRKVTDALRRRAAGQPIAVMDEAMFSAAVQEQIGRDRVVVSGRRR